MAKIVFQSTYKPAGFHSNIGASAPTSLGTGPGVGLCPESLSKDQLYSESEPIIKALCFLIGHHNADRDLRRELKNSLHEYLDSAGSTMVWLKRVKHVLAYPMSKYLRNEPPPPPDKIWAPVGSLRRWMQVRLISFSRKNTHLWYSWLQSKRSANPLPDSVIAETYTKHFATLSKEDIGDDTVIREIMESPTFNEVLHLVRKQVQSSLKSSPDPRERSGSSSACFEATRGVGGQHGYLRETLLGSSPSDSYELRKMTFYPVLWTPKGRRENQVVGYYEPRGRDHWMCMEIPVNNDKLGCKIQAVLEPLKVRVISKGEALPYYSMRNLQKALHGVLRKISCFRLIGRPLSPDDLQDLRSNLTDKFFSQYEWFSIDYSAATDGLSWKFSGAIFRFIIGNLPTTWYQQALRVLGPHQLHYPMDRSSGKLEHRTSYWGDQSNGQLMGSILSFPILCLANLGVCLLNLEKNEPEFLTLTLEQRLQRLLINGDDAVYAAPQHAWSSHVEIGKKVGLEMSVGKAYHHRVYANVNSTSLHCDLDEPRSSPWQIDFLNSGLLRDQGKVLENNVDSPHCAEAHMGQDPKSGIVGNLNIILKGALPGKETEILKYCLREHSQAIKTACRVLVRRDGHRKEIRARNLFLPISNGGLGVTPPLGWKYRISEFDRRLASTLWGRNFYRNTNRPVVGQDPIDVGSPELTVPWRKVYTEVFSEVDSSMTGQAWWNLRTITLDVVCLVRCKNRDIRQRAFWSSSGPGVSFWSGFTNSLERQFDFGGVEEFEC